MTAFQEREEPEQGGEAVRISWKTAIRHEAFEILPDLWNATKILFLFLLICGIMFPLGVYAIGQIFFPYQANGSLVVNQHNQVVGSHLIGQTFTRPEYFHGRPSAAGYNASSSSGSNIGPTNLQLLNGNGSEVTVEAGTPVPAGAIPIAGKKNTYYIPGTYAGVKTYAQQFRAENHLAPNTPLPADIVTASGSGLDPEISLEAAQLQVNRIVTARHALGGKNATLTAADLRVLITKHTRGRDLGILGEPGVNVLELNLDLDALYGSPPPTS